MWNLYVWPVTVFALISFWTFFKESPTIIFNFLIFMTAVSILHLNAWDKEVGTKTIRIVYAIAFITWAFLPIILSKDTENIHFILVPLYIAVSNYAFRNWELTKNQPGLRKKSKILIAVTITISILASIILPIYISYYIRSLNLFCRTEEERQFLYKVPIERKIVDIGNPLVDNIKVSYADFEMILPFKKFERICYGTSEYKTAMINIDRRIPKGIFIETPSSRFPPKDKNGKEPYFETYSRMLYLTPDKISFLKDKKEEAEAKFQLLLTKTFLSFDVGAGNIYKFETSNIKGFEFINPERLKKNKILLVTIFDKNNNQYEIRFVGFSQDEIDYVLSSIRVNYDVSRPSKETMKGIRVGDCIYMNEAIAKEYQKRENTCKN